MVGKIKEKDLKKMERNFGTGAPKITSDLS